MTAEGVERPRIRELLVALGCDCAQGYLFARPMPSDSVAAWLSQRATPST